MHSLLLVGRWAKKFTRAGIPFPCLVTRYGRQLRVESEEEGDCSLSSEEEGDISLSYWICPIAVEKKVHACATVDYVRATGTYTLMYDRYDMYIHM